MKNKALNNLDLSFSEEQAMLLESAENFCRDQADIATVRSGLNEPQAYRDEVWRQMVELGWLGVAIPEQFGGSELGIGSVVPLAETMGRYLLATPFVTTTLASQLLLKLGSEEQKAKHLPAIAEGKIATLALLEGEDWGDTRVRCVASRVGDKSRLSGQKCFVQDARQAELIIATVSINGATALALLEAKQLDNSALKDQTLIDQTKRACLVSLDCVDVTDDQLIVSTDVEKALEEVKLLGALLIAAEASGSAGSALNTMVDYLKTRKQFGRLIGSYQALKHPAVDALTEINYARSLVYHAATVCNDGIIDDDAEIACRMAKAQATEALKYVSDRTVQFHGGMGFTYECDAQLYIRRAQWVQATFGDAAHHRKRLAPLLLD